MLSDDSRLAHDPCPETTSPLKKLIAALTADVSHLRAILVTGMVLEVAWVIVALSPTTERHAVQGRVFVDEQPAAEAQVVFHSQDGLMIEARATTAPDGRFRLPSRVRTGEYAVTLEGTGLPSRYADPESYGLRVLVHGGSNDFRLTLRPEVVLRGP